MYCYPKELMRAAYFERFLLKGRSSVINLFRELDESSMFGVKFQRKGGLVLFCFKHVFPLFSTVELKIILDWEENRNQLRASPVKTDRLLERTVGIFHWHLHDLNCMHFLSNEI